MKVRAHNKTRQKQQWSDPKLKKIALEPAPFSLKTAPSESFVGPTLGPMEQVRGVGGLMHLVE